MTNQKWAFSCLYPLIKNYNQCSQIVMLMVIIWGGQIDLLLVYPVVPERVASGPINNLTNHCPLFYVNLLMLQGW